MFLIDTEYSVVELTQFIPQEVLDWCREKYGDGKDGRWACNGTSVYFANPSDHIMFILKWS